MARWTAADIPDLTGRTAIVTGANSGLGFETSAALARRGATVIMGCRDICRGQDATDLLTERIPAARLDYLALDLADLGSVHAFAGEVSARYGAIDILVANAGVMAPPDRMETEQGYELQLGVNHLGHFALVGLLLPRLLASPGSRIVTVSSFAHEPGRIDFDDLQLASSYTPYGAYSRSKLANLLFMLELDGRLRAAGAETISVGAHPGFASTNLQAAGPFLGSNPLSSRLVLAGVRLIGQSAARGAEPQLYAATAPGVTGGDYYGPRYRIAGPVGPSAMSPQARDEATAARLWDVSAQLTGVDIDAAITEWMSRPTAEEAHRGQ